MRQPYIESFPRSPRALRWLFTSVPRYKARCVTLQKKSLPQLQEREKCLGLLAQVSHWLNFTERHLPRTT